MVVVATLAASLLLAGATAADATPSTALAGPTADVIGGPALAGKGVVVDREAGSKPLPAVVAESWVLADLTTGEVLAAKGAHRRARPASMLKTLTALTVMPLVPKDTVHKATFEEASADGGHVGIVPGATYTLWDLWHGLLLPSGNDAAAAIAGANGGMAPTVAAMQAEADLLQARDTTVKNPSGLDADGQLSSAYDMALIARAALGLEDFRAVTGAVSYDFPGKPVAAGKKRQTYKIYTQNRLLLRGYKGTVGGKTGFTSLAHRTFWGAAERNGHTLVVTLMQIGEPTDTAARKLLDWGFANLGKVTAVGTLVDPVDPNAVVSPEPTASQSPGSDGGSSASTTPTTTSRSLPWGVIAGLGAVLLLVVVTALWWRRRDSGPAPAAAPAQPAAPGSDPLSSRAVATGVVAAAAPPVRRGSASAPRAASVGTPSVVVTTPGQPSTSRPVPPAPAARTMAGAPGGTPTALEDTGPLPVVAGPAPDDPAPVATPGPTSAAAAAEQPQVPAVGPERARSKPVPGGHVRVIAPPSRDPKD